MGNLCVALNNSNTTIAKLFGEQRNILVSLTVSERKPPVINLLWKKCRFLSYTEGFSQPVGTIGVEFINFILQPSSEFFVCLVCLIFRRTI